MLRAVHGFGIALAALGLSAACVRAVPATSLSQTGQTPDETLRQEAYAWLDSLELGIVDARFVEDRGGEGPAQYAFVTTTNDLVTSWLARYRARPGGKLSPFDFGAWLKRKESVLLHPPAFPLDHDIDSNPLPLVVLSYVANHRRLTEESKALFHSAEERMPHEGDGHWMPSGDFMADLKAHVAAAYCANLVFDLTDPKVSRAANSAEIQRFLKLFPGAQDAGDVRDIEDIVAGQAEADRLHVPLDPNSATKDQLLAEWVYELEDVSGEPMSHPGSFIIFPWGRQSPLTDRLIDQGFGAVPALIHALTDKRLTRAHEDWFRGGSTRSIVRVRNVANQILARITGQTFLSRDANTASDADAAAAESAALAWWAKVGEADEASVLEQSIREGSGDIRQEGERLLKLRRERVVPALIAGYPKIGYEQRRNVISLIGREGGREADIFLNEVLSTSTEPDIRCTAACGLLFADPKTAIAAMTNDLRKGVEYGDFLFNPETVLASSRNPQAILSLREFLPRLPVGRRAYFLTDIGHDGGNTEAFAVGNEPSSPPDPSVPPAIEELLVSLLNDHERATELNLGGGALTGPQICDLASWMLKREFKGEYRFDENGGESASRTNCLWNANVWRRSRGLPPLPTLATSAPARKSAASMKPLLDAIVSKSTGARRAALARIEKEGLAALPSLSEFAAKLDPRSPARIDADETVQRMALIVRRVELTGAVTARVRSALPPLRKPLSIESLTGLIFALMSERAELKISRDSDLTGVSIAVRCINANKPSSGYRAKIVSRVGRDGSTWSVAGSVPVSKGSVRSTYQNDILKIVHARPDDPIDFFASMNAPDALPR